VISLRSEKVVNKPSRSEVHCATSSWAQVEIPDVDAQKNSNPTVDVI
jgi:hypothetical protein